MTQLPYRDSDLPWPGVTLTLAPDKNLKQGLIISGGAYRAGISTGWGSAAVLQIQAGWGPLGPLSHCWAALWPCWMNTEVPAPFAWQTGRKYFKSVQAKSSLMLMMDTAYSGRGSLGRLSSSVLPKLGFLELDAAVSIGSDSSQLSVALHAVCPQRRRPLFTADIAPATAAVSSPMGAALCWKRKSEYKIQTCQKQNCDQN